MKLTPWITLSFMMIMMTIGCNRSLPPSNRVFVVQPFTGFSAIEANSLFIKLKQINHAAILRPPIQLPWHAYYAARNRYRADSLIRYLAHLGNADTVIIGLTNTDVSTNNGKIADWGVMGLGLTPGNACVVSTFRLTKSNVDEQLFKTSVHELGHTQGLPHCPSKNCLMRDAKGGNHLDDENGFCPICKAFLRDKGWHLK